MSSRPFRIALIGLGKIARDQHVPAIEGSGAFELAATVDPVGHAIGVVPHFASLDQLLESTIEIDAAAICTPPRLRAKLAREALAAGLDVLLEKPPAASVAEAEALVHFADRADRTLFAAWHSREAAGVAPARRWLAERTIRSVAITWREDVRTWHPGQKWIFEEHGFGVFDPAINALSIATTILPGALSVTSAKLDIPANCAAPIAGSVALRGEDGLPVSLDMDFLQTGSQTWDIAIETDIGRMLLSDGGSVLVTPGGTVEGEDAEYPALYARFAELIHMGASDVDLAPLRLVEAALTYGERREVAPFLE